MLWSAFPQALAFICSLITRQAGQLRFAYLASWELHFLSSIPFKKTTSFLIPFFTVYRLASYRCLFWIILFKNFQGCCLLFNYQGSFCLLAVSATAHIWYHVCISLSIPFLISFSFFVPAGFLHGIKPCAFFLGNRRVRRSEIYNISFYPLCQYFFLSFFTFFSLTFFKVNTTLYIAVRSMATNIHRSI